MAYLLERGFDITVCQHQIELVLCAFYHHRSIVASLRSVPRMRLSRLVGCCMW